jgi:hypothetical protein
VALGRWSHGQRAQRAGAAPHDSMIRAVQCSTAPPRCPVPPCPALTLTRPASVLRRSDALSLGWPHGLVSPCQPARPHQTQPAPASLCHVLACSCAVDQLALAEHLCRTDTARGNKRKESVGEKASMPPTLLQRAPAHAARTPAEGPALRFPRRRPAGVSPLHAQSALFRSVMYKIFCRTASLKTG